MPAIGTIDQLGSFGKMWAIGKPADVKPTRDRDDSFAAAGQVRSSARRGGDSAGKNASPPIQKAGALRASVSSTEASASLAARVGVVGPTRARRNEVDSLGGTIPGVSQGLEDGQRGPGPGLSDAAALPTRRLRRLCPGDDRRPRTPAGGPVRLLSDAEPLPPALETSSGRRLGTLDAVAARGARDVTIIPHYGTSGARLSGAVRGLPRAG